MIPNNKWDELFIKDPASAAAVAWTERNSLMLENKRLRALLDPQLIEPAIINSLEYKPSTQNMEPLQAGAMLTLVAAFDRRIMRSPFVNVATHVTQLFGVLGRLAIAESVLAILKKGTLTEEKMNTAVRELTVMAEDERMKVVTTMKSIADCPTSHDAVH